MSRAAKLSYLGTTEEDLGPLLDFVAAEIPLATLDKLYSLLSHGGDNDLYTGWRLRFLMRVVKNLDRLEIVELGTLPNGTKVLTPPQPRVVHFHQAGPWEVRRGAEGRIFLVDPEDPKNSYYYTKTVNPKLLVAVIKEPNGPSS
jgi:hypothetical protein